MKKVALLFMVVLLLITLTACKNTEGEQKIIESAENATRNALEFTKNFNTEQLGKYIDIERTFGKDNNDDSIRRYGKILENVEYKIISIEESENTAVAQLEITNTDMHKVVLDYGIRVLELVEENNLLGENKLSDADLNKKCNDLLIDLIDRHKDTKVTNNVEVKLSKIDGQWQIEMTYELQNALFGEMVSAQLEVNWGQSSASRGFLGSETVSYRRIRVLN